MFKDKLIRLSSSETAVYEQINSRYEIELKNQNDICI